MRLMPFLFRNLRQKRTQFTLSKKMHFYAFFCYRALHFKKKAIMIFQKNMRLTPKNKKALARSEELGTPQTAEVMGQDDHLS